MFVLKFLIGIIILITICLNFFRIVIVKDISSNRKLFNCLVFLLILIFLFQFGLNFTMHRTVMHKVGYPGEPGIRGQTGDKGNTGNCVSDCGRKVCGTVLERDAHNALTYNIKKLNKMEGAELKRTLMKCIQGPIEEKGTNAVTKKLPKVDIDICKKKDNTVSTSANPKTMSDELVECISVEKKSDLIFDKDNKLKINYRIKNKLFLNKLKLICNSKQYLSILEKEHKNKPTEKKLIEYLSSIVIKWVEIISSFKFMIEKNEVDEKTGETKPVKKPIYIGLIFLMAPDAEFDVIETIKFKQNGVDKIIESPLREIEKYDMWHWGEITTESPLIVTTCIAKQSPPLAIQQKIKTILTNNYDVIFDSQEAYPEDIWNTTNCPYGQMGKNANNPSDVKVCVKRDYNKYHTPIIKDNTGTVRKCDDGFKFKSNISNNNLQWKECDKNCIGGKHLTDNYCNCACEPIDNSDFVDGEYVGEVNTTTIGKTCNPWGKNGKINELNKPSDIVRTAYHNKLRGIGDHNFCRDPNGTGRPWCYVTKSDDTKPVIDSCNINTIKYNKEGIPLLKKALAWKETEYRRKTNITFLHPRRHRDRHNKIYYPLGSVWTSLNPNKDGKFSKKTILVTGDIMPPVDYIKLWTSTEVVDNKYKIFKDNTIITFWRPKPPKGYIAFGDVITNGSQKPPIDLANTPVVCVAESCVSQMSLGTEIWNTNDIGRVDYRTEENYRTYNNLDMGIEIQEQNYNNIPKTFNPRANNTLQQDKDDKLGYPNNDYYKYYENK